MRARILIALLVLAASHARAQHGYLGSRTMIALGLHDRLWYDAWAVSAQYSFSRTLSIRGEARFLSVEGDLPYQDSRWLGLGLDRPVGTVTGEGFGYGLHVMHNQGSGLSAPIGYYMSFGLELYSGTTTEVVDPFRVDPELTGWGDPPYEFEYEMKGARIVYEWGIRKVLFAKMTMDLGAQLGYVLRKDATDDQKPAPYYMFPYDRAGIHRYDQETGEERGIGAFITLTPVLRVGYLF